MKVTTLVCAFSIVFSLSVKAAYSRAQVDVNEEPAALAIVLLGKSERFEKIKNEYMQLLSPGGRALLLANRRDYEEALKQMELCRRHNSASADYVRGFCLTGLHRYSEAIEAYKRALARVDLKFNPSSMFYLHMAIPFLEIGDYHSCLKYLSLAQEKAHAENQGKSKPRVSVIFVGSRLRALTREKMGQKKEAFESYVSFFGKWKYFAQLDKLLSANSIAKANAKVWLQANKSPQSNRPENLAAFYFGKGKAQLMEGNISQARDSLKKVIAAGKPPLAVYDRRFGNQPIYLEWLVRGAAAREANSFYPLQDQLLKFKDAAAVLLIQTYIKEGNYADACIAMRERLLLQPENQRQIVTHLIRMKDVPEVVLQSDVDVHSEDVELRFEGSPLLQLAYSMNTEITEAFQKLLSGPLMDKAQKKVEQGRFAECLPILDSLIAEKKNLPAPSTIVDYRARYQFGNLHPYVLELLRIATAVAVDRKNAPLSFANFGKLDNKSRRIWQPVEDRLLGRPAQLADVDLEVRSVFPRFIEYENFAGAVHLMKVGQFKSAAKEFEKVVLSAEKGSDPAYKVFAKALKTYCEKQ